MKVSKKTVVSENILVPGQHRVHNKRIIGVPDFRKRIRNDVRFFGRIKKREGGLFS